MGSTQHSMGQEYQQAGHSSMVTKEDGSPISVEDIRQLVIEFVLLSLDFFGRLRLPVAEIRYLWAVRLRKAG